MVQNGDEWNANARAAVIRQFIFNCFDFGPAFVSPLFFTISSHFFLSTLFLLLLVLKRNCYNFHPFCRLCILMVDGMEANGFISRQWAKSNIYNNHGVIVIITRGRIVISFSFISFPLSLDSFDFEVPLSWKCVNSRTTSSHSLSLFFSLLACHLRRTHFYCMSFDFGSNQHFAMHSVNRKSHHGDTMWIGFYCRISTKKCKMRMRRRKNKTWMATISFVYARCVMIFHIFQLSLNCIYWRIVSSSSFVFLFVGTCTQRANKNVKKRQQNTIFFSFIFATCKLHVIICRWISLFDLSFHASEIMRTIFRLFFSLSLGVAWERAKSK